jgi:hypothetical protein
MKRTACIVLLIFTLIGVVAAQGQDIPQINIALADLAARLQKTVTFDTLTSWSFEQNLYMDTALGCALVTGTSAPQGISAYTFKIVFEGVTYEYRVSVDGQIVFPCDANLLQRPIPTPSGEVRQCPTGFSGFLPPRLRLNTQGRVEEGGNPNRLRSAPNTEAQQIGVINPGRTFDVIGGPSCDDKGYVWWQVVIDGQVGWTAEGALPDDYYVEPVGGSSQQIVPTATAQPTPLPLNSDEENGGNTQAVEGVPALAGIRDNELTLFALSEDEMTARVTRALGEYYVIDIAWSADGRFLAFVAIESGGVFTLYVQDVTTDADPIQISSNLYAGMAVNFSTDSTQVIYGVESQTTSSVEGTQPADILIQGILTREAPSRLGTVNIGVGCGGMYSFPAQVVLDEEQGAFRRGSILELTPFGVIYTDNCTGIGTSLLNLQTGESVELSLDLSRVDVSPDGSRVVGISEAVAAVLTIVDLETLEQIPLGTVATPDQAIWGANDEIYYSALTPGEMIPNSDTPLVVESSGMAEIYRNQVAIHRVDLDEASDTTLYTGDAYAIGRMVAAPDGETLFFTIIPDTESWIEAINNGMLAPGLEDFEQGRAYFPVSVYRLAIEDGHVELVGENISQATFNTASFMPESAG